MDEYDNDGQAAPCKDSRDCTNAPRTPPRSSENTLERAASERAQPDGEPSQPGRPAKKSRTSRSPEELQVFFHNKMVEAEKGTCSMCNTTLDFKGVGGGDYIMARCDKHQSTFATQAQVLNFTTQNLMLHCHHEPIPPTLTTSLSNASPDTTFTKNPTYPVDCFICGLPIHKGAQVMQGTVIRLKVSQECQVY